MSHGEIKIEQENTIHGTILKEQKPLQKIVYNKIWFWIKLGN